MRPITIKEAVTGTGGRLLFGEPTEAPRKDISSVSIDSRTIEPGALFVAVIGENDGHKYLSMAVEKGCSAVLISNADAASFLEHKEVSAILVNDTTLGLQNLAKWYLGQFSFIPVAVTGSTGKTSTKDILFSIMSSKYNVISNKENFNNHLGVPLTAFQVNEKTEFAIFEMGMSGLGEIQLLADIVRPETALITNVGVSHLEKLGTRDNILKAKMEITTFMTGKENLIINLDNDKLKEVPADDKKYRLITAGTQGNESIHLSHVEERGGGEIQFILETALERQEFYLPVPGRHNAWNTAIAVGCGLCYGISLKEAAEAVKNLILSGKRLSITDSKKIKIIDDTYNASPDSMKAAIDVLTSIEAERRIAILADMFELGEDSDHLHYDVGTYAAKKGIHIVIAVGSQARFLAAGAEEVLPAGSVYYFEKQETLLQQISDLIAPGDAILVKGSHGMQMEKTVAFLAETRN